jgi:phosphoribosylglycinamide formyltransferase-1
MWLVPANLIKAFPNRMVNIHPALLPAYGGRGMYGMYVHQAIVEAGEKVTGITIHYVNEKYDEGKIIFQARCDIAPGDTPEDIADKVHALEYQYYPKVVEDLIKNIE